MTVISDLSYRESFWPEQQHWVETIKPLAGMNHLVSH